VTTCNAYCCIFDSNYVTALHTVGEICCCVV